MIGGTLPCRLGKRLYFLLEQRYNEIKENFFTTYVI